MLIFLDSHIGRVLDVEEGKDSYIIGTVFCENIERPNVFDEVENDQVFNDNCIFYFDNMHFFRYQTTEVLRIQNISRILF